MFVAAINNNCHFVDTLLDKIFDKVHFISSTTTIEHEALANQTFVVARWILWQRPLGLRATPTSQ